MSVNGDIRALLETAVRSVEGLPTSDGKLRVYKYVPDQVMTPCVILTPGAWTTPAASDYQESTREWVVQVVAGRVESESAQTLIDDLVETDGSASIIAAINAALHDYDGGGLVTGADEYVALPIGDLAYAACNIRVRIITEH